MATFVRAVITGFGFSLGKMIFEKVKERYLDPLDPASRRVGREDNGAGSFVDATTES